MDTMPAIFVTGNDFGFHIAPSSSASAFSSHHALLHPGLAVPVNVHSIKSGSPLSSKASAEMTSCGQGRCRSPVAQPLRHRQLPASFWQEPNVPRGYPCYTLHPQAMWAASSSVAASQIHGGVNGSNKQNGHVHKEFLERLQSAQTRGYGLAASRFPITEFLFYNYGLRSILDSSSSSAGAVDLSSLSAGVSGQAFHLRTSPTACSRPRLDGTASEKVLKPKMSQCPQTSGVSSLVNSGSGLTSAFPTLCPYLGYNCPNLCSPYSHRFWDCLLGQAMAPSFSSAASDVISGHDAGQLRKPAGSRTGSRTGSAYPARYHPFATT